MRSFFGVATLVVFNVALIVESFNPSFVSTRYITHAAPNQLSLTALYSTSSPVGDKGSDELLKSKLIVLEQVVKELHSRQTLDKSNYSDEIKKQNELQKSIEQDHQKELAALQAKHEQLTSDLKQELEASSKDAATSSKEIQKLEYKIKTTEQDLGDTIDELSAKLEKYKGKSQESLDGAAEKLALEYQQEINDLKKEIQDLEKLELSLKQKKDIQKEKLEGKIATLEDRLTQQETDSKKVIEDLSFQLDEAEKKLAIEINDAAKISELEEELKVKEELLNSVQSELFLLKDKSDEYDERMLIATAAVKASEEREKSAEAELAALQKLEKQMKMQLRIQHMTIRNHEQVQKAQGEEIERLLQAIEESGDSIEYESESEDSSESLFGKSSEGVFSRIRNADPKP